MKGEGADLEVETEIEMVEEIVDIHKLKLIDINHFQINQLG